MVHDGFFLVVVIFSWFAASMYRGLLLILDFINSGVKCSLKVLSITTWLSNFDDCFASLTLLLSFCVQNKNERFTISTYNAFHILYTKTKHRNDFWIKCKLQWFNLTLVPAQNGKMINVPFYFLLAFSCMAPSPKLCPCDVVGSIYI